MTDLESLPVWELCKRLQKFSHIISAKTYPEAGPHLIEAARRLERYAPVKIDPENPATWPNNTHAETRYTAGRVCIDLVECWDGARWWFVRLRDFAREMGHYTHWRRINNEPPEADHE